MRRFFITGTDTGVGKTHAACAMIRRLVGDGEQVAGMKPIASGSAMTQAGLRNEDALALMKASNVELPYATVNPYVFKPAIAPHLAAEQAGVEIDPARIAAAADSIVADTLVIEGAGGWCVPIGPRLMLADLVRPLTREVILVVGLKLGCINHALLGASQIARDGFELAGWVGNTLQPDMPVLAENIATLSAKLDAPRMEILPFDPDWGYA